MMLGQFTIVKGKRTDRYMRGQLSPQKHSNKLAASRYPVKSQSCKKMRNAVDDSNSSVAVPIVGIKSETQDCLVRPKNGIAYNKEIQRVFEEPNTQLEHLPLRSPLENNLSSLNSPELTNPNNEDVKLCRQVIVDGTDITANIPEETRISYFDLCRAQNILLHIGLTEGIPPSHAVFTICGTVNVANAIKGCNISAPQKDVTYWGKALDSYSSLGMDVGFLRSRVNKILDIKTMAAEAIDQRRYTEAKTEGEGLEESIRRFRFEIEKIEYLEIEIENMRDKKIKIDDERESIRKKAEEFNAMLKQVANSP